MASADRLIEVFNEAKAHLTEAERQRFLAEVCADDPELKQQVLSLLQAHDGAANFLQPTPFFSSTVLITEKPGDRIGRYKLLQKIGEGGCGVVYMAEQEEPVRRRVALKVIKLGMDTHSVIARFEAERQALALMDHPNIAKVLDAGATDTGRPYFVMELVRGIKITDYCDQNNLSTEERLKLFTQVCQAIQHAHQKGIIHRDIKPSNILVTISEPGSPGSPKVIDFGIAKATTGQRLTDKTVFTAFEQFIGTPAYMSPEQAMMTSLDVDTRTDIYALGVLLYELLTGRTPFDAKDLMAGGLDAMRHIIREQEPSRPSTRLSTMLAADLTVVARHRHAEPGRLGTLLRGDLDWIVMKALEKDRSRRYETANGLAMDIQHHLSNEPVVARPPTKLYRFQKLVRRNKLAFAATSAVTAALIIGLGVSTWMFFKEKQARERASTEAAKSQQVARFLKDMLKGVGPSVALGRDNAMLREILDRTAERIGKDLTNQPEVEVELRAILARTYEELGLYKQQEEMARKNLELARTHLGAQHPALIEAVQEIAVALLQVDKPAEAEKHIREALAMQRSLLGNEHPEVAKSLNILVHVLRHESKLTEAETTQREALAMQMKLFGNENSDVAYSLYNLALVLRRKNKMAEAELMHRQALAMQRKLLGAEHPKVAEMLGSLVGVLRAQGKLAEAESMAREALAMGQKFYGNEHPAVADGFGELAKLLHAQGKLAEVETLYREELAARRKRLGNEHADVATSLTSLGYELRDQRKWAEAESVIAEALAMRRKLFGNEQPAVAESLGDLSFLLRQQGKLPAAETTAREALAIRKKLHGDEHASVAHALHLLAWNINLRGKHTEAEDLSRAELAIWRKLLGNEHPNVAWALGDLTIFLRDQKKWTEAETTIRESLAIRRKVLAKDHPDVTASLKLLSDLLRAQGKPAEFDQAEAEKKSAVPKP